MKEIAENYLKKIVKKVIISVPAHFNFIQRYAITKAGALAGLDVLNVISDSIATVVAYAEKTVHVDLSKKNLLLLDIGGGNVNATILYIDEKIITMRKTKGNCFFGGADINNRIAGYFTTKYVNDLHDTNKHCKYTSITPQSLARLRLECEQAKCLVSPETDVSIKIENFYDGKDFIANFSYHLLQTFLDVFFETINKYVNETIIGKTWHNTEISSIILVGGSANIDGIVKQLDFQCNWEMIDTKLNIDESVIYGMAIQTLAHFDKENESLHYKHYHESIPFTLAVNTKERIEKIMEFNEYIEVNIRSNFTTVIDDQSSVYILIYELHEKEEEESPTMFATLHLEKIPLAPRHVPEILISTSMDDNSELTIVAEVKGVDVRAEIKKQLMSESHIESLPAELYFKGDVPPSTVNVNMLEEMEESEIIEFCEEEAEKQLLNDDNFQEIL